MARIEQQAGRTVIVAETEAEARLLRHGERMGGQLVLLEGYYPVLEGKVLLPDGISTQGAQRVRGAVEEAAQSHDEAERRRRSFRLVKD